MSVLLPGTYKTLTHSSPVTPDHPNQSVNKSFMTNLKRQSSSNLNDKPFQNGRLETVVISAFQLESRRHIQTVYVNHMQFMFIPWRHAFIPKLLLEWLFVQQFVLANNKENIRVPHYWPLVRGIPDRWIPFIKGQ